MTHEESQIIDKNLEETETKIFKFFMLHGQQESIKEYPHTLVKKDPEYKLN